MNGVRGGGDNHPWAKTHWTRQEAADYLSCSKSTIIKWEQRGILPFLVDAWGQRWFEPAEVRRVPPKRTPNRRGFPPSKEGKLQAIVFQMFEDKVPLAEIVKKLDITAQKVRALYIQSQYDLDDVLPVKAEKVIDLSRARLRVQEKEAELETVKAENERLAHEERLAKLRHEENEEARFQERKKKLGTRNLRPEGDDS